VGCVFHMSPIGLGDGGIDNFYGSHLHNILGVNLGRLMRSSIALRSNLGCFEKQPSGCFSNDS
jgi:hypothetical protein